jgi:hypothetical protein
MAVFVQVMNWFPAKLYLVPVLIGIASVMAMTVYCSSVAASAALLCQAEVSHADVYMVTSVLHRLCTLAVLQLHSLRMAEAGGAV